jgi:uncharacterized protein YjbI with pentapeptide repeats
MLWVLVGTAAPNVRLDVVRTALAVGGGTGALVTLMYVVRRQLLAERVATDSKLDAAERRITELYVKGVEQLGSENPTVRIGGLFALERLAENSPRLRETVVDVLCTYLRCEPLEGDTVTRVTTQGVLLDHLAFESKYSFHKTHWSLGMITLSGAKLDNFDFKSAKVDTVHFDGCAFRGRTQFEDAVIRGADFCYATFDGPTKFVNSKLQKAFFVEATFNDRSYFDGAEFAQGANFSGATFSLPPSFVGARVAANFAERTVLPAGWKLGRSSAANSPSAASEADAWLPIEQVMREELGTP